MEIKQSRVLKHPKIIKTILKNCNVLDPLVIFYNSPLYYLQDNKKYVAFLTIKEACNRTELGTVYTFPEFRKRGFMRRLCAKVCKKHDTICLLCDKDTAPFYKKLGFSTCKSCGWWFTFRIYFFNYILRPFFGYTLICMKKLRVHNEPKEK